MRHHPSSPQCQGLPRRARGRTTRLAGGLAALAVTGGLLTACGSSTPAGADATATTTAATTTAAPLTTTRATTPATTATSAPTTTAASGGGQTIVETGSISGDIGPTFLRVYAQVKQDEPGAGVRASLTWTVMSKSGQLLGTAEKLVRTSGPGDTQWAETQLTVPDATQVGTVTAALNYTKYAQGSPTGTATVDGVSYVGTTYNYKDTGYVTTTYSGQVFVTSVCKDAAGKAVASGFTIVTPTPGQRTPWMVSLYPGNYKITVAQCYASAHV
jgi:hypothetical protein